MDVNDLQSILDELVLGGGAAPAELTALPDALPAALPAALPDALPAEQALARAVSLRIDNICAGGVPQDYAAVFAEFGLDYAETGAPARDVSYMYADESQYDEYAGLYSDCCPPPGPSSQAVADSISDIAATLEVVNYTVSGVEAHCQDIVSMLDDARTAAEASADSDLLARNKVDARLLGIETQLAAITALLKTLVSTK